MELKKTLIDSLVYCWMSSFIHSLIFLLSSLPKKKVRKEGKEKKRKEERKKLIVGPSRRGWPTKVLPALVGESEMSRKAK